MELNTLEKKILDNLIGLIGKSKRLLIAFSGGRDSVFLLDILNKIGSDLNLSLYIAYTNHNLRGKESRLEEEFVIETTQKYNIPLFIKDIDPNTWLNLKRESIEMKARKIRYKFFHNIINNNSIDFILTAHHLDDRIETFFLNLLRSPSLDSLDSIPKKNFKIIRPILDITREEIDNYIKSNNLRYIEDSSNIKYIYKRNIIRNKLIPILKDIDTGYKKSFKNFFDFIENDIDLIKKITKKAVKKLIVFNDKRFVALDFSKYKERHISIKKRIVDFLLKKLNYPTKPTKILFKKTLKPFDTNIYYKADSLIITKKNNLLWFINTKMFFKKEINISLDVSKSLCSISNNISSLYDIKIDLINNDFIPSFLEGLYFSIDNLDTIQISLIKKDDRFFIKNSNGLTILKNLKQHLLDSKIPKEIIKETIVIKNDGTTISYILNENIFRVVHHFFVTNKTKRVAKISLIKK